MPRPVSWLSRIDSLRSSVDASVRSHYGRRDVERLFELQPRAALKLLERLPTITLGNTNYVERSTLAEFLSRVQQTRNVRLVLEQYRVLRSAPRRTLRELVPSDQAAASADSLPTNLAACPGKITITFHSVEQLAAALTSLATILTDDLEHFAELYELPIEEREQPARPSEYDQMMQELDHHLKQQSEDG